jgi:metallo-beta-lactamase class B
LQAQLRPARQSSTARALLFIIVSAVALAACSGMTGVPREMRSWNRSFPPYRIIGNIYYVGSNAIAQYLITTPQGHILLDSGFEASVPRLADNVRALGFRFEDVKILLSSHAHIDHVQGHALVRRMTGAQVVVSAADAPVIASGGKGEPVFDGVYAWAPCAVDRVIADGDRVTLGGTTLVAHLTPGHTRGATTWTMQVADGGRTLEVLFFPSANVNPGVRLVDNPRYPAIADDFRRSFAIWRSLSCDVLLGAHGDFYDMQSKHDRLAAGAAPNPFVDPEGYRRLIAEAQGRFEDQLARERR